MDRRYVLNCIEYLPSYWGLIGAEEIRSLEARRRESRTHSHWYRGALRRFQRDPALRSGRPANSGKRPRGQSNLCLEPPEDDRTGDGIVVRNERGVKPLARMRSG